MRPHNVSCGLSAATTNDGQSLVRASNPSIPQAGPTASPTKIGPARLCPLDNNRPDALRLAERGIRSAAIASTKTARNSVTLFDSASGDYSLTRMQRLSRASTAINEAVQASGFTDVEALVHEIHISDGPSAFYVTDANVRVLRIDAALLSKPRERQLVELLHELAHAKRHQLKCRLKGPRYEDDSSLNERTVERFATSKAAAWIKRFPTSLNNADGSEHVPGAKTVVLNMRLNLGMPPANRTVLRRWFREGAVTPADGSNEQARRKVGPIAFERVCRPNDKSIVEARSLSNAKLRVNFEKPSNGRLQRFINISLAGVPPEEMVDVVVPVISQFIELYRGEIDKGITFSNLPASMRAMTNAADLDLVRAMQTMMAHHGFGSVICRFEEFGKHDKRLIVERQVSADEPPRPAPLPAITTDAGDFQLRQADLFFPAPTLDSSSAVELPLPRYVPDGYFYVDVEGTADGAFVHPDGHRMDAHEMIYLLLTTVDGLFPGEAVAWRIRNMPDQLATACAEDLADIMGGFVFAPASSAQDTAAAGKFFAPHPEERRSDSTGLGKVLGKGGFKIFFESGWGEDRAIAVARLNPYGYDAAAKMFDRERKEVELARSSGAPVIACRRGKDLFGQPVLEFDEKIVYTIEYVGPRRERSAFPVVSEATLVEIDAAEAWARENGVQMMGDMPEGGLVANGGFRLFDLTGLRYGEEEGLNILFGNLFRYARGAVRQRISMDAATTPTAEKMREHSDHDGDQPGDGIAMPGGTA